MKARAVAALLALASACGDDGGHGTSSTAIPCDITQDSCRSAIFALTARTREQTNAHIPPSRIITRTQFAQETNDDVAMQTSDPRSVEFEAALHLLKFLPADSSASEAMAESNIEGVAAYYSSDTKSVTIVSDAIEDASSGSLTLSHEYTHALQDQRQGLQTLAATANSTDEIMAETALVEGEATILSDAVLAEAQGLDYDYTNSVSPYLDRLLSALLMDVAQSTAPFTEAQLVLVYPVGGRPLALAYSQHGYNGIAPFFKAWPHSFAEWIDTTRTNLPASQRCQFPDPPASYDLSVFDSFGATGLIALEVALGSDGPTAYANAHAWTADSFAVFAPDDQSAQAALAWRITLTDATSAEGLLTRIQAANIGVQAVVQASDVVITAASVPGVLDGWTVRNDCSTSKSIETPEALWKHLPRYLRSFAKGAEGGIRTRTP